MISEKCRRLQFFWQLRNYRVTENRSYRGQLIGLNIRLGLKKIQCVNTLDQPFHSNFRLVCQILKHSSVTARSQCFSLMCCPLYFCYNALRCAVAYVVVLIESNRDSWQGKSSIPYLGEKYVLN